MTKSQIKSKGNFVKSLVMAARLDKKEGRGDYAPLLEKPINRGGPNRARTRKTKCGFVGITSPFARKTNFNYSN